MDGWPQDGTYELLIAKNGHLYLRAMKDVVVGANTPLGAMGNGNYEVRSAAETTLGLAEPKGHIFKFQVTSAGQEALFAVGPESKICAPFTSAPSTFQDFFCFLESNGQVGFKLPCHEWSRTASEGSAGRRAYLAQADTKGSCGMETTHERCCVNVPCGPRPAYTITPTDMAVFRVTQTFPRSRRTPTLGTFGALLDRVALADSSHMKVLQKLERPSPPRHQCTCCSCLPEA